jgi:hypothetical protein
LRSVETGKKDEEKEQQEAAQKEADYQKQIQAKKQLAAAGAARLKEAAHKQHAANDKQKKDEAAQQAPAHHAPSEADIPVGNVDQARVAYSNWLRLGLHGETLASFAEKMEARQYFDFEKRTWGAVFDVYQKAITGENPPNPKEFAERLYVGAVWAAPGYRTAPGVDSQRALGDEALRAHEVLGRFADTYHGDKAGEYLLAEARRLDDAERASFVMSRLAPLASYAEPVRALRLALERLGPVDEVTRRLAEIDAGKTVRAGDVWPLVRAKFTPLRPAPLQLAEAIAELEAKKPKPEGAPAKKPAAPMPLGWLEAEPRFAALESDKTLETLLATLGVPAAKNDRATVERALLEQRRKEVRERAALAKDKKPREVFEVWVAENHARTVEMNRAVAALATAYARELAELRRQAPRLDADGVTRAVAAFRRRIGCNKLVWAVGELNPRDITPEERVDAGVVLAPVERADWNALLDPAWLLEVYERFDATIFAADAHKEAQPADKDDKRRDEPARDDKPAALAPNPAELEAAEIRLRKTLRQAGQRPHPRVLALDARGKVALAGRPEMDARRELYPDFAALVPSFSDEARRFCAELDREIALKPLVERFRVELHEAFVEGRHETASDFEALMRAVVEHGRGLGEGYRLRGEPLDKRDLETVLRDSESLCRVMPLASFDEKSLNLGAVRLDFERERKTSTGTPEQLREFALDKIRTAPARYIARYANHATLLHAPAWLVPEPRVASDEAFAEHCDLMAMYAGWPRTGGLRMTLKLEAVLEKLERKKLRKPSIFDGALSPLWRASEKRAHTLAGPGGLREALTTVEWDDIDHARWKLIDS